MDKISEAETTERKPIESVGSPSVDKVRWEKVKGKISDVENLGTMFLIHVKRTGLKRLWDKLTGITHIIPFDHRMFYSMMQSLGCSVDDLIGQPIEFADQDLHFLEI